MTNPLLQTTEPVWPLDRDDEGRRRARFESLAERRAELLRRVVSLGR